ncbi:hypothetical protein [Methylobacterium sp. PvR107]|uniref:hypothetical protein n=1 Tax=Methylobacterium sp. PvR107 TaxID=2806597 RepID=UPI001AE2ECEF|nr:hypothetical protein [Methylobacterium sp. PvR107]MBP1183726.1 hypothetical protein [Methylobacterium sp. PvR107]
MASTEQLAEAYAKLLADLRAASLTLMNHDADGAALVIAAIVDRCASEGLGLMQVSIGAELSDQLGLREGSRLKHGERPLIRVEADLGRQVRFELA